MAKATSSVANAAAMVRRTLAAKGWTSRQVSVRSSNYSMGSSITVRVLDASVPISMVRAIAEQMEEVRRDGFGEILSGGNRFVSVDYAPSALDPIEAEIVAEHATKAHGGEVGGWLLVVGERGEINAYRSVDAPPVDGPHVWAWNIEGVARQLAARIADERALSASQLAVAS